MKRINESLIDRGYVTWFDLTNMKGIASTLPTASVASLRSTAADGLALTGCDAGSTVDAMSDAIEGADVMIYGVSLAYKESANVSVVSALSILAVSLSVGRHTSDLMATLSCVLQCRMVRVGRAAQLGSDQSTVQLSNCPMAHSRFSSLCPHLRKPTMPINRSWT
eukprot:COSAG06_NODE_9114_length_1982_cov_8.633032_3_plen_165_part_00